MMKTKPGEVKLAPKGKASGVLVGYKYMVTGFSFLIFFCVLLMVFSIVAFLGWQKSLERDPWILGQDSQGVLHEIPVARYDVTPDLLLQFVRFVIPDLYYIDGTASTGSILPTLDRLVPLVDSKVLGQVKAAFQANQNFITEQALVVNAHVTRILIGTRESKSFVLNKTLGRALFSVEGRYTYVSRSKNFSENQRWDVEVEFVTPTSENIWGLKLVQSHEAALGDAPLRIPDYYFKGL